MISTIELDQTLPNEFETKRIENLDRINIFFGKNNSGKSRLLRGLFGSRIVFDSERKITVINEAFNDFKTVVKQILNKYDVARLEIPEVQEILGLNNLMESLTEKDVNRYAEVRRNAQLLLDCSAGKRAVFNRQIDNSKRMHISNEFRSAAQTLAEIVDDNQISDEEHMPHKMYIPILRGLRPFGGKEDQYGLRTMRDYFDKQSFDGKRMTIYSGLTLFDDLESMLLGKNEARKRVQAFEKFLSDNFFDGEEVNLVPKKSDDVITVLIGKVEREIHQLGDGIQAIIILTYPLFFNSEKSMIVLIEEPELNLHPGFQRILLKTLLNPVFKNFQYFFTSHSNHLIELMQDYEGISLYSVNMDYETQKTIVKHEAGDHKNILNLLGVNNASVLLSNCTIWVEGITDRLYIRKYLEIYFGSLPDAERYKWKEDYNYAFVEYSGSNIVHWDFASDGLNSDDKILARAISNRILLIADSDYNTDGEIPDSKMRRFGRLRDILGKHFIQLSCKEIENVLKPEIVEQLVLKKEGVDSASDLRINAEFKGDYLKMNLGAWIEQKYGLSGYVQDNTIKNKLDFAERAVSLINSISDLSPTALDLCRNIESFIKESNSG